MDQDADRTRADKIIAGIAAAPDERSLHALLVLHMGNRLWLNRIDLIRPSLAGTVRDAWARRISELRD